tara:strand:+ start:1109 stop:1324 length:216 start_codon:yes stop_codon:yes gene_type:complete
MINRECSTPPSYASLFPCQADANKEPKKLPMGISSCLGYCATGHIFAEDYGPYIPLRESLSRRGGRRKMVA